MHLVMDLLVVHELDFTITDEQIAERNVDWVAKVKTTRSREEYIKGLAWFAGIDLIKYTFAKVTPVPGRAMMQVQIRSAHWASKQPR